MENIQHSGQESEGILDKRNMRIKKYFNQRCVWFNKQHYQYLKRRTFFISKLIIKRVANMNNATQEKIVKPVLEDYKKFVDENVKKYNGDVNRIKKSIYPWIVRINPKTKKWQKDNLQLRSCGDILQMLSPCFIYYYQIGNASWFAKGGHSPNIFNLSPSGKQLYSELLRREEDEQNVKKDVEKVST